MEGVAVDIRMSKDRLISTIRAQAESGFEARQVVKRLQQLLPVRLKELKKRLARTHGKMALSERHALISGGYIDHIEEVVEIHHQALQSRIQYETHIMLFQARQTLSRLKR